VVRKRKRSAYDILVGKYAGKRAFVRAGHGQENSISACCRYGTRVWAGFTGLRIGTGGEATTFEQSNGTPSSTEGGVFFDKLSGCHQRHVLD
jgi:hypothetical protein